MLQLIKPLIPAKEKLFPKLEEVLYSGYIAQGNVVDEFEEKFQRFIGSGHSLSLNSGTAALHIALILAGVEDGDEVISTSLTAEPTNVAIKMVGAKIRWADVDNNTGNICPKSIEKNLNKRTKAIIVVDYAGIPVDVKSIQLISEKYNIPVIQDAAHALGAKYKGKRTGNHFPFTVFSFQAIKHMTTIDGGMLQIQDKDLYEKAKLIRWFGLDKSKTRADNNIQIQGFKYHMNNINATIGLLQLEDVEAVLATYIANGKYLDEQLKDVEDIELIQYYPDTESSYWFYTLKVKRRAAFIEKLMSNDIMAADVHKRNDLHDYLNDHPCVLPNLDKFYSEFVHLPCGYWVTEEDLKKIVTVIKTGW